MSGLKTIIAGSRSITDKSILDEVIEQQVDWEISEVVSGGCRGMDTLGEEWADEHDIECTVFEADWDEHGNAAGPIRNGEMAEYADALIAIRDGDSTGTIDMLSKARSNELVVIEEDISVQSLTDFL